MQIATAVILLLFGMIGLVGQFISAVNFRLAQRLGLQEKNARADPVYHRLERNTAIWDLFVLWTFPATGVLMLVDSSIWPYLSLVAGGVHIDTAGREVAKIRGLRAEGIRTGRPKEVRKVMVFFAAMAVIGIWAVVFGALNLG